MRIDLLVKYPLLLSDFHETVFSRESFEKYSSIKFHENRSSLNRVVPCSQLDGQTDMTKLTVSFCYFKEVNKKRGRLPFVD
jgi:hypothetical protein